MNHKELDMSFLRTGNKLTAITAIIGAAGLLATGRAFLNHEIDSLALLVTAQVWLLGLIFVPRVLSEVRDRKTLSVYREMYIGR
jgi:hypothetical protein